MRGRVSPFSMHEFTSLPQPLLPCPNSINHSFAGTRRYLTLQTPFHKEIMCWWTWVSGRACAYTTDTNGRIVPQKKSVFMAHGVWHLWKCETPPKGYSRCKIEGLRYPSYEEILDLKNRLFWFIEPGLKKDSLRSRRMVPDEKCPDCKGVSVVEDGGLRLADRGSE
jgi:hypothetical protein